MSRFQSVELQERHRRAESRTQNLREFLAARAAGTGPVSLARIRFISTSRPIGGNSSVSGVLLPVSFASRPDTPPPKESAARLSGCPKQEPPLHPSSPHSAPRS